ncbi:TetR/AcrR family transcriptional regulator [Spongisporangium articulatum]|uniref:TetR/AcrR family transcriptional regulator n=1 Tax=Spongisporangium articulatum TaxID=3362603 RepID=A0ABW8AKK4_9ACTN
MRSAQRILDAAVRMIEEDGFENVNVVAVAKAAGVSRQTVYTIFGSREDLVGQAMAVVAFDLFKDVRAGLPSDLPPGELLIELVVMARRVVRGHPALSRLLTPGADSPFFEPRAIERALPLAGAFFREALDGLPGLDEADALELIVRIVFSVLLMDSPAVHEDDDLRTSLRRWVLPLLVPVLGSRR